MIPWRFNSPHIQAVALQETIFRYLWQVGLDKDGACVVEHGSKRHTLLVSLQGAPGRVRGVILDSDQPQGLGVERPGHALAVLERYRIVGRNRIEVMTVWVATFLQPLRMVTPGKNPLPRGYLLYPLRYESL